MMHLRRLVVGTLLGLQTAALASAQTPPPPVKPAPPLETPRQGPATQSPPPRQAAAALTMAVQVTDKSGNPVADVAVAASGPVERSAVTGRDGTVAFRSMRAGQYRLRFEHEKFITLEREQVIRAQAADVSVSLNPAPVKAAPPPPPPEPVAKAPERPPSRIVEPRYLDIPDYVERNLVRSEPQKTTNIGCTDGGTVHILQVRDTVPTQQHDDFDEVIYVVASSGVVRVRDSDMKMVPGAYLLIPRGVPHSIRRTGNNPLITLSMFLGAPCTETGTAVK
jgi:mannose-6-phosphate isomerase-like protein (cupin superfamily)